MLQKSLQNCSALTLRILLPLSYSSLSDKTTGGLFHINWLPFPTSHCPPCAFIAELSHAKGASGAPWVRKWSNLPIQENLAITWPYTDRPPERPSVRTTGIPMKNNSINRYGNPNAIRGYFGGNSHSHQRLVKQRKPKESMKTKTESGTCFCIRVTLNERAQGRALGEYITYFQGTGK